MSPEPNVPASPEARSVNVPTKNLAGRLIPKPGLRGANHKINEATGVPRRRRPAGRQTNSQPACPGRPIRVWRAFGAT